MNRNRPFATASKLAILALALSGFAAQAQQPDLELQVAAATVVAPVAANQSLKGIVVTGYINPLLRSDQRLAMLNASLPLDGKNGAAQPTELQQVAALFPQSPNAAAGESRRMMERSYAPPVAQDPDGDVALGVR